MNGRVDFTTMFVLYFLTFLLFSVVSESGTLFLIEKNAPIVDFEAGLSGSEFCTLRGSKVDISQSIH